jgi:hypothetical protein
MGWAGQSSAEELSGVYAPGLLLISGIMLLVAAGKAGAGLPPDPLPDRAPVVGTAAVPSTTQCAPHDVACLLRRPTSTLRTPQRP